MTLPFLESWTGQSTDQLLALEGKYRTDSLVLAFEGALLGRSGELTDEESYVVAVEALEREVNNGGYSQFFLNSSGEYADVIEAALRAIGCPKTADITREAIDAIGGADLGASELSDRAANADDDLRAQLEECDAHYFSNDEPIADRLFEWIRANRTSIRV